MEIEEVDTRSTTKRDVLAIPSEVDEKTSMKKIGVRVVKESTQQFILRGGS